MALLKSPATFPADVLGLTLWTKQLEILQAVRDHRRVAVASGHSCGKTLTLATLIVEWMSSHRDARVICTASTNRQVHTVLWAEVQRLYARSRYELPGVMQERDWKISPTWRADAVSVDDPTAIQGVHGPATLVVVDEAEGLDARIWSAIESLLSSEGSRLVVAFNPVTPSGKCFEIWQRPDLYRQIQISCLDHPNVVSGENVIPGAVTSEWIEEIRQREGVDSPFWASRVLGQFPKTSTSSLLTLDEINAADVETGVDEAPRIGVDVARFGDDKTVLVVLDRSRSVVEVLDWHGQDTMKTVGAIIDAMSRHSVSPDCVSIDSGNVGGPVVDRLLEQGFDVQPVDFGSSPRGDWASIVGRSAKFSNRKAELHWAVRAMIRQRVLRVSERWDMMRADLVAPTYSFTSQGKIAIESKDDLKKRLRRSPDFGDALVVAVASIGSRGPLIQ